MPTEQFIRHKAVQILKEKKWVVWCPSKVKYKQNDIFGIIDLLAVKGRRMKKIQLTTLSNVSGRRKKIKNFLKKFKVGLTVDLWAWDKKRKKFRKEKINIKLKRRSKK